jgi:glyoxylase-like metal-dependent hydrolase (beta-lactamase superfamily II)
MPFVTEPEPLRGIALSVLPGITRVVAANPGVMTYHGTNTYLVDAPGGLTVIDPGPRDDAHVAHLLAAAGARRIALILLTHTHPDHCGAVPALTAATGALVHMYRHPARKGFVVDVPLDDGDVVGGFTAVHTPGHAADHLCFAYAGAGGAKILFSGDHVMPWSSSIVSPPEGDMGAYYRSLEKVLARDDDVYLSAHGPLLENPRILAAEMLAHRVKREVEIVRALEGQAWSVHALAAALYAKTDPRLRAAAQRNVLAHMLKLLGEGRVEELAPEELPAAYEDVRPPPGAEHYDMSHLRRDACRRFALKG